MSKLEIGHYSGSTITQKNVVDVALTSNGSALAFNGDASFKAEDVIYRKIAGELRSYFVKGTLFRDNNVGFSSSNNIAIYLKGTKGQVVSNAETETTIYAPNVKAIAIKNSTLKNIEAGDNWVKVQLPQGSHQIELLTNQKQAN